uniref:C2H2-type domain-containing protein n=1 Tax=Phytophthora fragariae TaxID=53985 RepID=A0A6A3DDV9_9STRA|nr:hypothetical protein PF009_g31894 [Phytophthora fragariae]
MQQLVRLGRLGYVKLPGALTAQLLELLDREVVTPAQQDQDVDDDGGGVLGFEKIFLNADVIDKYRRQAPLPPHIAQRLTEELRDIFKTYFPGAIPRKWSILKSYPGGPMQGPHRDFSVNFEDGFDYWDYTKVPGTIILAVHDGTRIHGFGWNRIVADLTERFDIVLNRGDVLLFRGEFVHCGVAYQTVHIRIHCYLEPRHYPHPPNTTEIVAVFDPDEIRLPENQCPTCGNTYATRQNMLRHAREKHGLFQNRHR